MSDINSKDEWIRLPRPKERCPHTGLSRTSLAEILDEKNPATGEPYVMQYRKERHGKQRRTRLINRESLLEYFKSRSKVQNAVRFASHVHNPNEETVETVVNDLELFQFFVGPENEISKNDWEKGRLSKLESRIQLLIDLDLIAAKKQKQNKEVEQPNEEDDEPKFPPLGES